MKYSKTFLAVYMGIMLSVFAYAGNWWITPTSKDVAVGGGSFSINISNETSDSLEYTAGADEDWISIGTRNYYSTTVNVKFESSSSIYSRSGYVTVSAFLYGQTHNYVNSKGYRRCYVTQAGRGASFSPSSLSFDGTNSVAAITVSVNSGIAWQLNSSESWLSLDSTYGTGTKVIRVFADRNETGTSRTATVKIYDDGVVCANPYSLRITQSPIPPPSHAIKYMNTNGADNPNPTLYYEGDSFEFEPLESIGGYCFNGWVPSRIDKTDNTDIDVSASWVPINYTIAYDANGGVGEMENILGTYDSTLLISSNAFTWANHRFIGWATNAVGDVIYAAGETVSNLTSVADGVVTLYAQWEDYLAPPVFTPLSGTVFDDRLSISIACACADATIHYTLDGAEPTAESPVYSRFRITGKTTVKAIAVLGELVSDIAVAEFAKGYCTEPVVSPTDGSSFEHSNQEVTIAWSPSDGVLRYTLDGSDPTAESPTYDGPFSISESTVVKAKVFSDLYFDSSVVTANLMRIWVDVPAPQINAAASFTGSKTKVSLSCDMDDATIRYTLNGNDPNSHSAKYAGPFYVHESCVLRAYASLPDYRNSAIATQEIVKVWGIGDTMGKPDHAFATTGTSGCGWIRVEDASAPNGEAMKSGAITHNQTSILSTKVMGPGTLSFSWRSSCEYDPDYEWDHAEFSVDGEVVRRVCGETQWQSESVQIVGDGEHSIEWRYTKDDVESAGDDAVWVAGYGWASSYTATRTSDVPVPYNWLTLYDPEIIDEYEAYESAATASAANGHKVWECYVAGTDPTDTNSVFTANIEMVDGAPVITWSPELSPEQAALRAYTVYGKTNLTDQAWHSPTNEASRFFRVGVEMR